MRAIISHANAPKKNGQVNMSESVAILAVFFILVVIGFIFYAKIQIKDVDEQKSELEDLKAIEISQTFIFLPEIQCRDSNVKMDNCIDILKLESLPDIISDPQFADLYYEKLQRSHIRVVEIYPDPTNAWTPYKYSLDNFRWTKNSTTRAPIILWDSSATESSSKGKFKFGVIIVSTYS